MKNSLIESHNQKFSMTFKLWNNRKEKQKRFFSQIRYIENRIKIKKIKQKWNKMKIKWK